MGIGGVWGGPGRPAVGGLGALEPGRAGGPGRSYGSRHPKPCLYTFSPNLDVDY